jgi:DNA-binding transcriptional ArsR family regulator
MNQPFGGLLGDTAETRLLQFLLPMYGIEFDMAELVEEIGLTRQSVAKAMNKFAERGMVKIRKEGRTPLYTINEDSPLVKRLEDFDNSLIESMVGPEVFWPVRKEQAKAVRVTGPKFVMRGMGKTKISYSHPVDKVSGVASRSESYSVKKRLARNKSVSR